MKNLILILLLLPLYLNSQVIFQKELSYDYTLSLTEIIKLPDNGYMGCGWTKTDAIDSTHAIVVRLDSLMQVQWCKRYTILARDDFRCIEALSDGNFLVGGTGRQEFSSFYGATMYKIDGSGNVLWHKLYSNVYDDAALGVFEQTDNSLVLFVRYGVTGQPSKILKTDALGNLLNEIELSTTNVTPGIVGDCVTDDGSGYYFLGGTALNSTTGKHIHYILKASDNNIIWYNEYDLGRESAYLYDIAVLSDGNVVITGNVTDASSSGLANIALMKVDQATGSVIWVKEIKQADEYFQSGYSIGPLAGNEMMVCGQANTALGFQAIAVRLSVEGEIIWANEYGDGPYESLGFISEVSGNRYLFGGRMSLSDGPYFVQTDFDGLSACLSEPFDFVVNDLTAVVYSPQTIIDDPDVDPMSPAFEMESFSISENTICSGIVTVEGLFASKPTVSVYPNPVGDYITVLNPEAGKAGFSIEIYNIQGELIHRVEMHDQDKVIETPFIPGVYSIVIRNLEKHTFHSEKFVIK